MQFEYILRTDGNYSAVNSFLETIENDNAVLCRTEYAETIVSPETFYRPPAEGSPYGQRGVSFSSIGS